MQRLLLVITLALAVSADSEADAYRVYGSYSYPTQYSGSYVSPYYNQYKPAAYYNSHYFGASPYAYRYRRDAEAEPEADPQHFIDSPYTYGAPVAHMPYAAPVAHMPYAAPVHQYVSTPAVAPLAAYAPTTYAASIFENVNGQSMGTFLPGVFGWNRGHNHFPMKRRHHLTHLPGHRHGGHHDHGLSGGEGKGKGKKGKRSADAEPEADPQYYIASPYVASPYGSQQYTTSPYVATQQYAATPYVYANQYKPAPFYNSHYYSASPYANRYRRDAEAEPEADSQVYMTSPSVASPYVSQQYTASPYVATQQYTTTPYVYANQYPASTYTTTYPAATYPAATYASAYPQPAMTYAQPKIATTAGVVATPYAANPFFFKLGLLGNNLGGKASYGGSYQKQGYPNAAGHDDHYHGHFHINDGWGLYDEDLRDDEPGKKEKKDKKSYGK